MADQSIADRYPCAFAVVRELRSGAARILGKPVDYLIRTHGESFWAEAERLVGWSLRLGGTPYSALLDYTLEYLRAQALFRRSHQYTHVNYEDARREVYDNPAVMQGFYLDGLMLTHAFWPIHYDIHRFFQHEFLPRVPDAGTGSEIGFGHGLYLLDLLNARPGATTVSYDISEFSEEYANRLLRLGGIDPARFELHQADARERLPIDDASCEWMIFAEVLEHIPDPAYALRELARCLVPGAPLFATTVIDSNAIDHLYQFEDVVQIRTMLRESGFEIAIERTFRVSDYEGETRDPTTDVAFVCTRVP
jgi:SAM-dependent methyltransferase